MIVLFVSEKGTDFNSVSLETKVDWIADCLLLRVLRSQTLIDPLLDPTTTCSSECVKVSAVSADTLLLICGLRTVMGLGETRL